MGKKSFSAMAIVLLVTASVALSRTGIAQAEARQPEPSREARLTLAEVRSEAARARARAAAFDRQAGASNSAGERATIEAAALAARVQQAEAQMAESDAALAAIRQQRRALDLRLAQERAPAARLVAGLQSQLRRPALLVLAQPGTVADAVHLRAVLAAVEPQIRAQTVSLRAAIDRSGALEQEAGRLAAKRRALQADLLERRERLAVRSAAELLKARRAAGAADREAERAFALSARARDLSALERGLRAQSRERQPTPPKRTGGDAVARSRGELAGYRLPIPGARLAGEGGIGGVTLLAPSGALAVAPAAGRVAFAGPYRGFGDIVIIEHVNGWTSLITGLGSLQVAIGQPVIAGSPLGQAPAGRPRIRLELRRNGERVNPLDQIR